MNLNQMWDATAFGATMSATLSYGPDEDGKRYTFTSCEEAERGLYKTLSADQVEECRKNVDEFYANPKLQMQWKEVILHPVCVIMGKDRSLEPVSIAKLKPDILEKYQRKVISYRGL